MQRGNASPHLQTSALPAVAANTKRPQTHLPMQQKADKRSISMHHSGKDMTHSPALSVVLYLAQRETLASRFPQIQPLHLLLGILKFADLDLKEALGSDPPLLQQQVLEEQRAIQSDLIVQNLQPTLLRRALRNRLGRGSGRPADGVLHRSPQTKALFSQAEDLARREQAANVSPRHFLKLLLEQESPDTPPQPPPGETLLKEACQPDPIPASPSGHTSMETLLTSLKTLRDQLRKTIFGQEHAIRDFVEGLFNAELTAEADTGRHAPRGVFVFAGPPGVGKTFLAQSGAQALGKPFRRFDMSGYSDHQSGSVLMGMQKSYKGASPGLLTDFVAQNPQAILLFDEIEKAHLNILHLFLQILDAGTLEDRYHETQVSFRDTVIIFTTNAGKALYDATDVGTRSLSGARFHRRTLLGALEQEQDPRTGKPVFPQAICSRMATGTPILFNHLGVNDLVRLVQNRLEHQGSLLEETFGKKISFGEDTALCLVMQEGLGADARTLSARTDTFVKAELFKLGHLYRPDRFQEVWNQTRAIHFLVEHQASEAPDIQALFQAPKTLTVLAVVDRPVAEAWTRNLPGFRWLWACDAPSVHNILETESVDLILLDLWVEREAEQEGIPLQDLTGTIRHFDHLPLAARGLSPGREILRMLQEKHPEHPCFLASFSDPDHPAPVDDELLMACMRQGNVRGVLDCLLPHPSGDSPSPSPDWSLMARQVATTSARLWQEQRALELQKQRKVLAFETAPGLEPRQGLDQTILIRLRNLNLTRAVASEDVSEVLDEVDRPDTCFGDVFGADVAKEELRFLVDWLGNPASFRSQGIATPRGILLAGPPGTGKTMLARALAGECGVAFLSASATDFVTQWQGSGPQNIRALFARARRYAPSIVFIDEIDAIGKQRVGSMGAGAASEQTLNALLTEMDGFRGKRDKPVIVLAATNLADLLDEALLRRFSRTVEVDKPDRKARRAFLDHRLRSHHQALSEEVLDRLARQSASFTIAQMERVVDLALRMAVTRKIPLDDGLLEEAFERMRMGEARPGSDEQTLLRVARHEAGHAVLAWQQGSVPVQMTIMARGGAGGYVEHESREELSILTRGDLQARIRGLLGGRAAELLYYGPDEGLSTGASSDLERASSIALQMVDTYGMDPAYGLLSLPRSGQRHAGPPEDVRLHARKLLQGEMDRTVAILEHHRDTCDRLVTALLEHNRLTRPQLIELLGPSPAGGNAS